MFQRVGRGRVPFTCPVCGADNFTTDGPTETSPETGRCKGHTIRHGAFYDYTGCTFTWDRKDDALYFADLYPPEGEPPPPEDEPA